MKNSYTIGLAGILAACATIQPPAHLEMQPNQLETHPPCDSKKATPASGLTRVTAPNNQFLEALTEYIPPGKKVAFMPVNLDGYGTISIIAEYGDGSEMYMGERGERFVQVPLQMLILGKWINIGLNDFRQIDTSYNMQIACLDGKWSTYLSDFAALEKLQQAPLNELPQADVSAVIEAGRQVQEDLDLERKAQGFLNIVLFDAIKY